jgi:hypothetical protein
MPAPDRSADGSHAEAGRGVGQGATSGRRVLLRVALVLWVGFVTLACGELLVRSASRFGVLLLDIEMWRYARQVKRPSDTPGVVLEHRPNVEATLMGARVRTDERGFRRAAPEIEATRGPQDDVVAIVGDSCAFGWGVDEGETMSDELERLLDAGATDGRRFTVLNAGVGNSNTAMEYARYLRDVRPLAPKWVVLAFFINDAEPDPKPQTSPLLEHSALLAMLGTRVPELIYPSPRHDYMDYYGALYAPGSPSLERFRSALQAFGRTLREDGIGGTVILIPEMHDPRDHGPFAAIYAQVAAIAEESGFEVIDASQVFPSGSGERYWVTREDPHPNGEAHRMLAAALLRSRHASRLLEGAAQP